MSTVHAALFAYTNAIQQFERSAGAMLADMSLVRDKAAALPVAALDDDDRERMDAAAAAVGLLRSTLLANAREIVTPAAKAAAKESR